MVYVDIIYTFMSPDMMKAKQSEVNEYILQSKAPTQTDDFFGRFNPRENEAMAPGIMSMKSERSFKRSATALSDNPEETDLYEAEESEMMNHIRQTLSSTLNQVFLARLTLREKKMAENRIKDAVKLLMSNNPSFVYFIQNLYNSMHDRIEMSPEQLKSFITTHITTIAMNFTKHTSGSQLLEGSIQSKDFQSILAIPSTDSSNPWIAEADQLDRRVYYVEERKQRRYDSLARLLSMSSKLSVCTAVTMLDSELIIAANCSCASNSAAIINALKDKLSIVREALETPGQQSHETIIQRLDSKGGLFQKSFIFLRIFATVRQKTIFP